MNKNGLSPLELSIVINQERILLNLPSRLNPKDFNKKRKPSYIEDLLNAYRVKILSRLYKRRISAVHIHDVIVIPETRAQVEISTIEKVMRDVYKQFGLHPTLSTDIY